MRRTKSPCGGQKGPLGERRRGHLVSPPFKTSGCRGLGNEIVNRHGLPIPGDI